MDTTDEKKEAVERPYRLLRRAKLAVLVREAGGPTELGRIIDTPKSHISAMQSGARNVGDDIATKLEERMHKPLGWMDQPVETDLDAAATEMLRSLADAPNLPAHLSKLLTRLQGLDRELAVTAIKYLLDAPDDATRVTKVQEQLERIATLTNIGKTPPGQSEANTDAVRSDVVMRTKVANGR